VEAMGRSSGSQAEAIRPRSQELGCRSFDHQANAHILILQQFKHGLEALRLQKVFGQSAAAYWSFTENCANPSPAVEEREQPLGG
jgi:hypothetical protein